MKNPSSPRPTRWLESIDLMNAEIVVAHVVMVETVQLEEAVLHDQSR